MPVQFKDNRRQVNEAIAVKTTDLVARKALQIENHAKRSMIGGSTRTAGGIQHIPSRPGDPPRVVTGRGRASITHEVERQGRSIVARVGSNVVYMRFLELGTIHMEPRPWLRPALLAVVNT